MKLTALPPSSPPFIAPYTSYVALSIPDEVKSILSDLQIRFDKTEACEGQRVGQADTIRIFPVGETKGMEFDGVIFWDAGQLEKETNAHNLDRLMYVAISRASFYVAVTFEKYFPKSLNKVTRRFTT